MLFRVSIPACIIASSFVSAFPALSDQIPQSLRASVPFCAQSCVERFLNNGFPVGCVASGDLNCLCSQYGEDGFSLSEGILRCTLSSCPRESQPAPATFYAVCLSREDAVLPTHNTLTVTTLVSSTSSSSSTASASGRITAQAVDPTKTKTRTGSSKTRRPTQTQKPSSSKTTTRATSSQSSRSKSTQKSSSKPSSSRTAPFSTTGPPAKLTPSPASTSSAVVPEQPGLSTEQIIGISVAGGAAVVLGIGGIVILSLCRRRRLREDEDDEPLTFDSVVGSPEAPFPPPKDDLKDPRGGSGGVGVNPFIRIQPPPLYTQPSWEKRGLKLEEIGIAISPEAEKGVSPASMASARTVSRLLPEKPDPCHVEPLSIRRPDSSATRDTMFEEEMQGYDARYSRTAHGRRPPSAAAARNLSTSAETYRRLLSSPESLRQPPLALETPLPPVMQHTVRGRALTAGSKTSQYAPRTVSSIYSYGAPSVHFDGRPITEIENDDYIPPYYTRFPELKGGSRSTSRSHNNTSRSGRDSAASMTSFESIGPDDPTPPEEEDKQLSPVPESPINALKYPKVPRASNQAVARSPTSSLLPPSQHQSLVSKRRGDDAAHDLERTLWITDSNTSSIMSGINFPTRLESETSSSNQEQPGVANFSYRKPAPISTAHHQTSTSHFEGGMLHITSDGFQIEPAPKSPWERKITPSRRGHDLFLSVT